MSLNFDLRLSTSVFLIGFQISGPVGIISLPSFTRHNL
ncbi:TPA: MFS transporter [Klebsiella variicola]|nr:MFS transporter [Klebsiella variicola subsp. variicola]